MYIESIPVVAGADLHTDQQYHALIIGGTIAPSGLTAMGILQNKPKNGEDATLAVAGRSRYRAGAAITAGVKLMVTTSGWLITATSGSAHQGRALGAVSSGGVGEAFINFAAGYAAA